MLNFAKNFLVPISAGFFLHLAIDLLNGYLYSNYGNRSDLESVPLVLFYSTNWLNLLHAVLPGLAVGFLAKRKPAILGFISILLAQSFIGFWQTDYAQPDYILLIRFSSVALPMAFYGLVSAITGFAIRQKVLTTQSR